MRDLHVVSLRYRLAPAGYVRFDNPSPLEWTTEAFHLRMEEGIATVEMAEHYHLEREARERVEHYLRRWEAYATLRIGRLELRFEFEDAQWASPQTGPRLRAVGEPEIHVIVRQYPSPPPPHFFLSPDAETLWHRYEGYLDGREPLASMGYMCLSVLEASAGGRQDATNLYNVSERVLSTLGYLTSEVGDQQTARKAPRTGPFRPYTDAEKRWIEAAIRAIILRVAEWAYDPSRSLQQVTMADLPNLPSP